MKPTDSEIVWYIAREGEQHGPLSDAEMQLFVKNGHLKPTDLVWNPEMADWQTAASVFPPPAPPTPSPPPPPATPKVTSPATQGSYKHPAHHENVATTQGLTPSPTLQVDPGTSAAAPNPNAHAMAPADPTHATLRPEPSLMAGADVGTHQPAPVEGYEAEDEDDEQPRRRGRIGLLIGTVAVAAAIAGGGVVAFQNKDAILSYMNEPSKEAAPPVVKAETNTKTAALEKPAVPKEPAPKATDSGIQEVPGITVTVPPTQPVAPSANTSDSVPLETIDRNLQKSQLWRVIKTEFPDWYQERVQEISKLSNTASETDLSKHLINKLVALRREHAKHALSSSAEHLQSIAGAFLANLKSLAGHSTDACYTFHQ